MGHASKPKGQQRKNRVAAVTKGSGLAGFFMAAHGRWPFPRLHRYHGWSGLNISSPHPDASSAPRSSLHPPALVLADPIHGPGPHRFRYPVLAVLMLRPRFRANEVLRPRPGIRASARAPWWTNGLVMARVVPGKKRPGHTAPGRVFSNLSTPAPWVPTSLRGVQNRRARAKKLELTLRGNGLGGGLR